MRVIRSRGQFGTRVEVVGIGREPAPVALARVMERPIGRGGGMRDPLPGRKAKGRPTRDRYVAVSVSRAVDAWVKRQADERGLSVSAFLGLLIEGASRLSSDALDDLVSNEAAS